jgi:ferredoxin
MTPICHAVDPAVIPRRLRHVRRDGRGWGMIVSLWPAAETEKGTDMRVVVDFDLCESNAVCMGIAPEIFEVRDDDFLYVLDENPPESMRAKLEESVQRCPKQAISIVED